MKTRMLRHIEVSEVGMVCMAFSMDMEGFRKNNTVLKRSGMHMNTVAPFSIQLKSTVRTCPGQGIMN